MNIDPFGLKDNRTDQDRATTDNPSVAPFAVATYDISDSAGVEYAFSVTINDQQELEPTARIPGQRDRVRPQTLDPGSAPENPTIGGEEVVADFHTHIEALGDEGLVYWGHSDGTDKDPKDRQVTDARGVVSYVLTPFGMFRYSPHGIDERVLWGREYYDWLDRWRKAQKAQINPALKEWLSKHGKDEWLKWQLYYHELREWPEWMKPRTPPPPHASGLGSPRSSQAVTYHGDGSSSPRGMDEGGFAGFDRGINDMNRRDEEQFQAWMSN